MVNRAPTASPPDERYPRPPELRHVHFFPRILVSTYDDARVVSVKQQQWVMMGFVLEQPIVGFSFVSEGWSKLVRSNDAHQSSKERLKYGFVDFET